MFAILFCISNDHDLRLVVLAAVVCMLSCATAVLMLRQAHGRALADDAENRPAAHRAARRWLVAGGAVTGFGIWATHFIAMLGYDPGVVAGYRADFTIGSLLIVVATTTASFRLVTRNPAHRGLALASLLAGGGFAAMHYVGMAALVMPAAISWRIPYVVLSVILAIAPLHGAFALALSRRSLASGLCAAAVMVMAIVGLHFSGMTAIRLVPGVATGNGLLLSSRTMAIIIGAVTLAILALALAALAIARRTDAAIAQSQRQFSILVKSISDCAIYMLDPLGRVTSWNAGAERLKGYREKEAIGLTLANFYTAEDRAAGAAEGALAIARDNGKFTGEGWRVRKDGSRFWAHVTIERIADADGALVGFAKITRDMTRFKQDQDRIEDARRQLDAALSNMHQGLCLFDADDRLVLANRRFFEMWALPADVFAPGTPLIEVARGALEARTGEGVPRNRLANMHHLLRSALEDPTMPPIVSHFDDDFCVSISSRAMAEGGFVTTFDDITENVRSKAQIAHLAHHDILTGLANRTSYNRWIDRELDIGAARGRQVAVVAIDLNRFKEINDEHGHAVGDAVLRRVSKALDSMLDDGEIAARLGGDEFAAAKHFVAPHELADFIARLEACFASTEPLDGVPPVGASIGVALFPQDGAEREALLNNADLAMYRAKTSGTLVTCFFEKGMDEQARRRRVLANDLRNAIGNDELTLLYQEQRSLATQALSGYEALLRWNHPTLGPISPVEFIPIAEENREIVRIGEWVLREACRQAATWDDDMRIAVNVSPIQLVRPDLPELVAQILVQTGLSPRRLELEITETALISDKMRALHSLRRIKALGVTVAMDDFGTGYSSLDTLHSFPFDKIKIDKSFLAQAESSEEARAIIRAVLALGRSLSIPVLAEGVETAEQFDLLVREGCHEAQGYYFGRPAAAPCADSDNEVPARAANG